jgi:hypothetical protein
MFENLKSGIYNCYKSWNVFCRKKVKFVKDTNLMDILSTVNNCSLVKYPFSRGIKRPSGSLTQALLSVEN